MAGVDDSKPPDLSKLWEDTYYQVDKMVCASIPVSFAVTSRYIGKKMSICTNVDGVDLNGFIVS